MQPTMQVLAFSMPQQWGHCVIDGWKAKLKVESHSLCHGLSSSWTLTWL